MINLPCNATSMSQVTPCQNVPVQTSQYNFPTCQQRQTSTQQMQTAACGPCSGISQAPFTHVYQPDTYIVTHQCAPGALQPITNPCHPVFQSPPSIHPTCGQLPQNILDQIRACVSNAAPIFILPQQSPTPQQQQQQQQQQPALLPQAMPSSPPIAATYPPSGPPTYPSAACYYPPPLPFYPYPVSLPFCEPFIRGRETARNCGCCRKGDVGDPTDIRNVMRAGCRYDYDLDEHRCTPTTDDAVCSQRNCPSSLHLQALASQFLSMQGVIPCAATRLVLRKVPGSNVTTTMEDTMARAQKAINVLTKDQLLSESKNAQQVNTLINLHMTANPPPNIIPILTLVQLKMNLLKAQVEGLVNQKIMEIQGIGVEVDTQLIDPTVLALKSDAELRDFLSVLRQRECDERVNVNFAPYRSQRAIAETRLSNVQNKIRQVEAEFDRRRCAALPAPTLSTRVVQQFSRPCYSAKFEDPRRLYSTLPPDVPRWPDPFRVCAKPRSPKRLLLKPCADKPKTAAAIPPTGTARANPHGNPHDNPHDNPNPKTAEDVDVGAKESTADRRPSSTENCACCADRTTSEESVGEAKKKLWPRIVEIDAATVSNVEETARDTSSLVRLTSNVCVRIAADVCGERTRTPCDARRWRAEAYVNVADDESVKTLTESGSDTITLNEKIEDVCESRDVIEIRGFDRRDCGGSADDSQRSEKQAETEIAISRRDETIKERDVETKGSRDDDASPPKVEQDQAKSATTAVVNDDPISRSARETERQPRDGMHISSSEIMLRPKTERREDERRDENRETPPLSVDETERGAVSKSKKKTRFHVVSLMTNIVYDKSPEYRRKRSVDKRIATSGDGASLTADLNIEKLDKYSSMENLLRNATVPGITGKDHSENAFPEILNLSKFCIDCQCQTMDERPSVALLRASIFPPLKNSRKYAIDNEKKGDDVGIYPRPITEGGITTAKRLSHGDNVTGNIFISDILSVIGNRVATLVNKIIALNRRLLNSSRGATSRENRNVDVSPMRDRRPGLILKDHDHDPRAGTSHYPVGPNQETPNACKHDFRDASLPRVSTGTGYGRMRRRRHAIIEDKENGTRYLLIGTSSHDLILTRDLGRPYEVRRSLLIRSRPRDPPLSPDCPHPFSLLKRTGGNVVASRRSRTCNENMGTIEVGEIRELRGNEKFWALSEIAGGNDSEISEMREYGNAFEEQISNDDIANNIAVGELVINVHDHLGVQTEINTDVHESRSACLLTD